MTISVAIAIQSLLVLPEPVMDGTESPKIILPWNSEESMFIGYPLDQILSQNQYPHIP